MGLELLEPPLWASQPSVVSTPLPRPCQPLPPLQLSLRLPQLLLRPPQPSTMPPLWSTPPFPSPRPTSLTTLSAPMSRPSPWVSGLTSSPAQSSTVWEAPSWPLLPQLPLWLLSQLPLWSRNRLPFNRHIKMNSGIVSALAKKPDQEIYILLNTKKK